jgi:peptidyl-prolyl cis-trans isomerase SurA
LAGAAALALATALGTAGPAYAQRIMAVVNGTPITSIDVSQRRAFMRLSQHKSVTERQAVDDLIDQALILNKAKQVGVTVPESAVDGRYDQVAQSTHLTPAQLGKALAQSGASERTFKNAIRTQLAYQSLLTKRFDPTEAVSRDAVTRQLQSGKSEHQQAYRYTLRQIIFVVPKSASSRVAAQRHSEAEALRRRFSDCASGTALAHGLHDVAVKPPAIRDSEQLPKNVREELDRTKIGHLSPPERVDEGYQLIAVCKREAVKGNVLARQEITQQLANEQFKKEAADYIKALRRSAVIQYR